MTDEQVPVEQPPLDRDQHIDFILNPGDDPVVAPEQEPKEPE